MSRFAHVTKSELVSAAEAAQIRKVSRATINRLAAAGLLRVAHQMPGKTGARLFDRAEVESLPAKSVA
jgi:predicted site-specific integrase-resolvase